MKAIVITEYGAADRLQLQEREVPVAGQDEVLIKVYAAGLNRPDIFQRQGKYPAPPGAVSDIPGLEVAGEVVSCGSRVSRWTPGDRICALVAGGGYAAYAVAHASHCLPIPDHLSYVEAASLPETVFTVWHNVFQRGGLTRGESFLVHGGGGGIGTTAIQLASLMGARVYATAGTDEKVRFCEQLGAISCINYRANDFAEALRGKEMDVILDNIGAPYFERHISLLADDGRMVFINAVGGRHAELNLTRLMQKRITLTGSTLRGRSDDFKAALCQAVERQVWPLLIAGDFKTVVYRNFPLSEASKAHEQLESGDFMGKLVLEITH